MDPVKFSDNSELNFFISDIQTNGLKISENLIIPGTILSELGWEIIISSTPTRLLPILKEILDPFRFYEIDLISLRSLIIEISEKCLLETTRGFFESYLIALFYFHNMTDPPNLEEKESFHYSYIVKYSEHPSMYWILWICANFNKKDQ